MKFKLTLLSLMFVSSVQAATLTPKKGVEILFVNGIKTDEKRETIEVEAIPTQLLLRYNQKLGKGSTKKVFDSAPFVVTLDVPESDLVIQGPKVYSYEQAKLQFKSQPKWDISDSQDNPIVYKQEKLKPAEGFMPYYDLESMLQKYNKEKGIALGGENTLMANAQMIGNENKSTNNEVSNLEQLQGWYLKATKEERKAFQKWVIDHN
ncbi:DUF2057 domain-containing protein [Aliivibrio fischeri]|uniref:YccT family protein n=1 Tax=Aliivibrio fischeri TaxID=668 RepID=UPI0002F20C11|nr:DUF2057 domain-containing protein [Aliivibrio fischeri]MCE4934158.1 DUF2057 domain-containing protein [Aliivibrio fischeri]MUH95274.1 DUF2057 domain-containing protein [Aliivibrio fischeri]MUI65502.1 DUF2057 domain-containing protein [Aliivibrio fischeri]MUJ23016.1 DUF2057 domain-containing protein [Aliivibrio fischeri]OCH03616.1 hypothetical protein A6E09_05610 [Aliivibrio fischeri]